MTQPEHLPVDGPLYWLIESRTDPEANYLCYLGANSGYGTCACTWGRAEIDIAFREGRKPKKMCWHLDQAHRRFHKWAIYEFEKRNPNREHDKNIQR